MKVTLEFILPEQTEDYKLHFYGPQYSFMVDDFMNWIRQCTKHGEKDTFTAEEIREKMNEIRMKWFDE